MRVRICLEKEGVVGALDPLTLSSVEKAPAILFSRDVQCLRLLCKCCTVDERPLLTDAQSAKLLKRVLEWPHAIRAHCQQDGVVSKGADADADDGSGAGCGERTDATCDLWPVEQEPGPGRVDSSSAESLSDAPSFRDWCACCSLTLMQDQCGVRMSETAAAGLRVLAECFKPVWSKHPEAVSVACSAANINCLKYLLAEKASTLFVNKNDRTNCYHLAVLAESFQLNGTSDLLSSAYKVQHRTMGGHGNSSGGHGDSSGGRGDSAGSHGDDGDAAVGEQQAWPDLFGADMVQGVTDAYADVAAAHCIKLLWKQKAPGVDAADVDGFTPLMRACAAGRVHCVLALLECGASVCERDLLGVSPLHMAAAVGHLHCIQALLHHGHRVDCVDNQDWPPLMYANFSASERCVVELMKAKPEQLSLLGRLLRKPYECEDLREKTQTVICSILTALGNHDRYYSLFNEFVRGNIDLLDDDAYAFASRSTGLLDLPNKRLWLERRLQSLRETMAFSNPYAPVFECDVDRDNVLDSAVSQLLDVPCSELLRNFPSIAFLNEPGICTGPKREFLSALSREIAADRHALFIQCDDHHYMPRPVAIFQQVAPVKSSRNKLKKANLNIDLSTRRDKFMMIGRLLASAFAHGYQVDFSMAKPLIKQLLGRSLNHPHELRHVDSNLHRTTVQYLMDHPVAGVLDDLVFCCELELPLGSHGDLVEFPLARNGDSNLVTDSNKSSYVYRLSKFKLEDSIAYEVKCLVHGFCEVVPRALLSPFRPAEFQLLLCGVSTIDVEDWKKHTRYAGFNASDACICWFWEVVASLSQEERSLLLQFATSLTRLPAQGFAGLKGLGNTHGFTVSEARRPKSMIPMASTCFNRLDLPRYTSKSELRDKVLIAVRHGSQGFSFA